MERVYLERLPTRGVPCNYEVRLRRVAAPDRNLGRGSLRVGGAGYDHRNRGCGIRGGAVESTSVWAADNRVTTEPGGS